MTTAQQVKAEVVPWSLDFLAAQRKAWVAKGGEVLRLSNADHAELMQKMQPVGDDIVKTKPDLKPMWDALLVAAKRNQ